MMYCLGTISPAFSRIIKVPGMFLSPYILQVIKSESEPNVSVWVIFHVAGIINTETVVSAEGLIRQNTVKPIYSMQ